MVSIQCTIKNPSGLHARPAQELVKLTKQYKSTIRIKTDTKEVDAKSIFGLLSAAVKQGSKVEIWADGEDETIALAAIEKYISALEE